MEQETEQMEKWLIVDGTGILHRAYHGFGQMKAPGGHSNGTIYGTIHLMNKYIQAIGAIDHAIVVFDPPGGSLARLALYPEYKAQRPSRAEEITKQEPWVHAFLKASGLPVLVVPGDESDDVMATIAKKENTDKKVAIFSADKDMAQVIRGNTFWFRPDSASESGVTRMNSRMIHEKFGVRPHQIRDYLALLGDTSDNLIGVDKVGEKTAAKLLGHFGSIDQMYVELEQENALQKLIEAVGGATAKKIWQPLQDAKSMMPTMVKLVELMEDIPISRELYANRMPVNDQMMEDMRKEHGLLPSMGYFLPWQQERARQMNEAKRFNRPKI